MKAIVSTASHAEVRSVVRAAECTRFDVIELEPRARGTAPTVGVDEGARLAISFEDLATYRAR